jgi:hypothetical protein
VRRNVIERFRSKHGKKPVARLETAHIEDIMTGVEDTPQAANNVPGDRRGAPFTAGSLSNWFGKQCRAAGLMRRTAHGLRKATCRRLAEAGASVHESP